MHTTMMPRLTAPSGSILAAALLAALLAAPRPGNAADVLGQSTGPDGCISQDGDWACTESTALHGAFAVAVSKDGKSAYVASVDSDTVAVLARDRSTGALSQLGCISDDGSGGLCDDGVALFDPVSLSVSPDNRNVYVASHQRDPVTITALAVLARDRKTGALEQLAGLQGCVSDDGTGGLCTDGVGLRGVMSAVVSNDGRFAYVASNGSSAVAVFARDRETGALTQLAGPQGCISEDGTGGLCIDGHALLGARHVLLSKDGRRVYVASERSRAVAVLSRDRETGALTQLPGTDGCISEDGTGGLCVDGDGLGSPTLMALSPNGKHLYVTSPVGNQVAVLGRDKRTGALSQLPSPQGCISDDGNGGICTDGYALRHPFSVAVGPDNRSVYVTSRDDDALAVLARDDKTGALTQAPSPEGCISEDGLGGLCADGRALGDPRSVVVSSDGRQVYVAAQQSDAVAVLQREK